MGVVMLLYLVKHSLPDISNSVIELSKVADGATEAHFKALLRTVKYSIDTGHLGLLIQPKWNEDGFYLERISDSEYAGDPDTRISVYGYVLYFCGAPIAWKSKAVNSVTLSSNEAEYYATSEIAKEVIQLQRHSSSALKKVIHWLHLKDRNNSEWELECYYIWLSIHALISPFQSESYQRLLMVQLKHPSRHYYVLSNMS
jgi:hypothetical protein